MDTAATKAFLAQAVNDPAAALYLPAKREVDSITEVVGADDVGPDTKVGDQTVTDYLREAERDIRPVWPRLAARLKSAREDL